MEQKDEEYMYLVFLNERVRGVFSSLEKAKESAHDIECITAHFKTRSKVSIVPFELNKITH